MGAFSELLGVEKRENEIDDQGQGYRPRQNKVECHGVLLRLRVVEKHDQKMNGAGRRHEAGEPELEIHRARLYSRSQTKTYQMNTAKKPRPKAR